MLPLSHVRKIGAAPRRGRAARRHRASKPPGALPRVARLAAHHHRRGRRGRVVLPASMKICRFDDNRLGLVEGDSVHDVSAVLAKLPTATYPFPKHDALIAHLDALRPDIESAAKSAKAVPLKDVKLLSPVANPGKIIAA